MQPSVPTKPNIEEEGIISALALNPKQNQVAVAFSKGGEGGMRIYDTATGGILKNIDLTAEVDSLAYSPDGKLLAAGRSDGFVSQRSTADWTLAGELWNTGDAIVPSLRYSDDGKYLFAGTGVGNLCRRDCHTGVTKKVAFGKDEIWALALLGKCVYAVSENGCVAGFDSEKLTVLHTARRQEATGVICAVVDKGRGLIITGDRSGNIQRWNAQLGKIGPDWVLEEGEDIYSMCVSPEGTELICGGEGGKIARVDAGTGSLWEKLCPTGSDVLALAYAGDGTKWMAGVGWNLYSWVGQELRMSKTLEIDL